MQDAKMGAFLMAKEANVPLVPITIRGANKIMPNGKLVISHGTVECIVHPPLDPSTMEPAALRDAAMTTIQSKMQKGD